MSEQSRTGTFGLSSRGQMIVAVGLFTLLMVVVVARYVTGGDDQPKPLAEASPATTPLNSIAPEAAALTILHAQSPPLGIPEPPRVLFITRDPFEPSDTMRHLLETSGPRLGRREGVDLQAISDSLTDDTLALGLKAISGQGSNAVAFLANQVVRPGDTIEGLTVIAIQNREVIVAKDGYRLRLTLPGPGADANSATVISTPNDKGLEPDE